MRQVSTSVFKEPALYERVAGELIQQIQAGSFRTGERIPSVRQTSQSRGVSVTTVLQAYRLLEDQRYVEARPQSGYYVLRQASDHDLEPPPSTPNDPTPISMEELHRMVMRNSSDTGVVQFGVATPAAELLPTAKLNRLQTAVMWENEKYAHICSTPEGCEELRVQIAQRAFRSGCTLAPQDIVITNGCMEAVYLALRATCNPGDLVAIESPTYFGLLQTLSVQGLKVIEIPTHPRTGISLEALRLAVEHHPIKACLLVSNFNNPLGSCMPDEHKQELVEFLGQQGIPLIEDDIHGEIHFSAQRPKVSKAFDHQGLVLYCSSFTKDISPNCRLGWIVPGKFLPRVQYLKLTLNVGSAIYPQLAIARFLGGGGYDHHLRKIRRVYQQKVTQMAQAILKEFPTGTRLTEPAGGFVLWVQMPQAVDALELHRLAQKNGIALAPGQMFSVSQKYNHFIRLNAAHWSYETAGALQRLGRLAHQLTDG